ncbi:hypothetical protein RISK_002598 [Rhodopirellula islandica]|uniref:Uncharacterized protein n=1 Tax=Rhodopirellula islandica TaxID=595434 RepID=A0A0J1BFS8_RHOIS|nr:hypothetical protein RISK_002598 [Rhodopirellula islandica]
MDHAGDLSSLQDSVGSFFSGFHRLTPMATTCRHFVAVAFEVSIG